LRPDEPRRSGPQERAWFLNLAGLFEGGLLFVALGLAWLFGIDVVRSLHFNGFAAGLGLVAALPPFAVMMAAERLKLTPFVRIMKLVQETLGPWLAACRWYDLILLALLAGLSEEVLFRGVAQPLFERLPWSVAWRWTAAVVLSNVIFGLLHLITPTYAVLAGAMGVYFALLLDATGSRNLLPPIVAHGFYDYLAFLTVVAAERRLQAEHSAGSAAAEASQPSDKPPSEPDEPEHPGAPPA
jgi:membrane protease YdiL (CAAX protease family)